MEDLVDSSTDWSSSNSSIRTFVICLILPLEHLLAVPKNIIVIIMTIIV
jgi:hypothetical protein